MKLFADMSYTRRITWRIRILWCLVILMLAYMILVGETGGGDSRLQTDLAESTSRILFFGGLIWLFMRIRHNKKLLKDRLLLKQQALREQDEYRRMLHLKSGGPVMDALLLLLYGATMTASLYNMDMFHMAYSLLAAAILLKAGTYFACRQGWLTL